MARPDERANKQGIESTEPESESESESETGGVWETPGVAWHGMAIGLGLGLGLASWLVGWLALIPYHSHLQSHRHTIPMYIHMYVPDMNLGQLGCTLLYICYACLSM